MFKSYTDWLYEGWIKAPQYGTVMLGATIPNWESQHLAQIEAQDIYDTPAAYGLERGLEHDPHCTLVYGFYIDKTDPQEIKAVMKSFFPLKVKIKEIGGFRLKDCDVIKYNVPNKEELKVWRERLLRFPNYQFRTDYKPHITIAYVNSGTGRKYLKKLDEGFDIVFNKAIYCYTANQKDNIVVEL